MAFSPLGRVLWNFLLGMAPKESMASGLTRVYSFLVVTSERDLRESFAFSMPVFFCFLPVLLPLESHLACLVVRLPWASLHTRGWL